MLQPTLLSNLLSNLLTLRTPQDNPKTPKIIMGGATQEKPRTQETEKVIGGATQENQEPKKPETPTFLYPTLSVWFSVYLFFTFLDPYAYLS